MSTKNNPSPYDGYAKAEPDEPYFVLLGRDPLAPGLVRIWAWQARHNDPRDKHDEALACAHAMDEWRLGHLATGGKS